MRLGLQQQEAEELAHRYGSNISRVFAYADRRQAEAAQLPLPLYAALEYAIEHEQAVKPADFLIRRTGAVLFHIEWAETWKDAVGRHMAQRLGHSAEQAHDYAEEVSRELHMLRQLANG